MRKIRVGILGGSFNPPHSGHLHISELAIKRLKLKQLWWIPTLQNPLKETNTKASYDSRLKLCSEITKEYPKIKIKDLERVLFSRAKKCYTYNLLKRINKLYPNHEFYFIMGADSLVNFHKWFKFKEIPKLAKLVVLSRKGYNTAAKNCKAANTIPYLFINEKEVDISSTEIRKKVFKS